MSQWQKLAQLAARVHGMKNSMKYGSSIRHWDPCWAACARPPPAQCDASAAPAMAGGAAEGQAMDKRVD
eukprot:1368778-Pleurochrysis_carterae.AAC.1